MLNTDCPSGKEFYTCAQGPYQGCCSSNPCHNNGICPDDDSSSTTSKPTRTTSRSDTLTKLPLPTFVPVTSTGSTAPSTTSVTVLTTITNSASKASSSSSATSAKTSAAGQGAGDSDGKPSVGAIVGGVIGAIVCLILLLLVGLFVYRRRKRYKGKGPSSPTPPSDAAHAEQAIHAPTKQEKTDMGSSILTPTEFSTTGTTPISPSSPTAELDGSHPHHHRNSPLDLVIHESASASELSDTGVYRTRAELAAHSYRELINVPAHQRQPSNQSLSSLPESDASPAELASQSTRELINRQRPQPSTHQSPPTPQGQSQGQGQGQGQEKAQAPTTPCAPIITADGVVLTANFDTSAPDSLAAEARTSHAMSFMDYDASRKSMLQGYGPDSKGAIREEVPDLPKLSSKEKSDPSISRT
ncbi:hypothetical protein BDV25DRAFT_144757 [Aspergillus avenaceus]|uniref:Uncharacterized protein n=1 Tax=Aspergillus avenaceus TaxID=36643 RepID=A0A5N6TG73_ASPAV|nr:hypothetical protein BDV25DRAFT_144757 [Aspergillus avenaceus]